MRIVADLFGPKLKSDETMEASVLRPVNYAHPAPADLLDDAIVRDGLTDQAKRVPPVCEMLGALGSRSQ